MKTCDASCMIIVLKHKGALQQPGSHGGTTKSWWQPLLKFRSKLRWRGRHNPWPPEGPGANGRGNDSWLYMGVSLNDGTPKTRQNDHFYKENSGLLGTTTLGTPIWLYNFPETNDQFSALLAFGNVATTPNLSLIWRFEPPPPPQMCVFSPSNHHIYVGTLSISARLSFPLWLISLDAKLSDLEHPLVHQVIPSINEFEEFLSFFLLLKFRTG